MATVSDEQKILDYEMHKFLNRVKKFNSTSEHLKVKDIKLIINQPEKVNARLWFQFWKKK